jgi:hypothetical protein
MRVAGPCVGILVLITGACGARTGLDDVVRDAGPDAGRDARAGDGGADTFPCRWTIGRPLELERDPSEICAINGAVHGTADEVLLVWQDVSCDLAPFEGVRAVAATLDDPPRVIVSGTMPHPFGFYGGTPEGYVFAESSTVVRLFSTRLDPLAELETGLFEVYGLDRIEPNRVYGLNLEMTGIQEWSTRGRRQVGPRFDAPTGLFFSQLVSGDVWIGVDRTMIFRQHPGRDPFRAPTASDFRPISITPDHFNPGIAVLSEDEGGARYSIYRIDAESAGGPMLRHLTSFDDTRAVGRLASNETEALLPLAEGTILIQRMNGAPAGRLRFTGGTVRQAEVLMRPGSSVGGVFSNEIDARTGEHTVIFRPMVCNR